MTPERVEGFLARWTWRICLVAMLLCWLVYALFTREEGR